MVSMMSGLSWFDLVPSALEFMTALGLFGIPAVLALEVLRHRRVSRNSVLGAGLATVVWTGWCLSIVSGLLAMLLHCLSFPWFVNVLGGAALVGLLLIRTRLRSVQDARSDCAVWAVVISTYILVGLPGFGAARALDPSALEPWAAADALVSRQPPRSILRRSIRFQSWPSEGLPSAQGGH